MDQNYQTLILTEINTISIDQKIFQGFKGYNSLKSELEVKRLILN